MVLRRALSAPLAFVALLVSAWIAPGTAQRPDFDLVIANGRLVDGTGAPWTTADVGIVDDRIRAIGISRRPRPRRASTPPGLVVAPGFIDMLGQSEFNVLVDSRAASKLLQGITTEVTGEGCAIAPLNDRMLKEAEPSARHVGVTLDFRTLGEYFDRIDQRSRPALNVASFVGAGGVRNYVIGKDDRPATPAEMEQMKRLVAQAMEEGALGLSTSLQYVPDRFASTDEIVELAKVAASHGGVYLTHQRSEGNRIFESLDEVFAIAERAKIPAEIWHLKTAYKANWGKMPEVLRRIEAARARASTSPRTSIPYNRASNGLDACLPVWAREGGLDPMLARLQDPAQRARIKQDMEDATASWENQWYGSGGGDGVMLVSVLNDELRKYEGKTLTEIGRLLGKDPRDAVMDLVIADRGESAVIISIMSEDDVQDGVAAPAGQHRHRLGREGRRRPAGRIEVAPAGVGLVPAHPRQVRPRRAAAVARGGRPQVHLAAGGPRRPARPRSPAARHGGRHHRVRSGDHPRRVDVRGSESLLHRRPLRARERAASWSRRARSPPRARDVRCAGRGIGRRRSLFTSTSPALLRPSVLVRQRPARLVHEPRDRLHLLVVDLLRPVVLRVVIGVQPGVEPQRRHAILQERPLVAPPQQVRALLS